MDRTMRSWVRSTLKKPEVFKCEKCMDDFSPAHPEIPLMASVPEVLVEFVKACLERGMTRADIAQAAESGGWSPREARNALDAFADVALPVPVPKKRVSGSPRDAFLHLLGMAMLYTAAFATGAILFQFIERWLPAATDDAAAFSAGSLRAAAAALLVSLPILGLVHRTIGRDASRDPAVRLTPIYRTLAYLTLLITALIMAGDLISAIVCFLSGDLTARFILKAATILMLAGGIYLWFSSDVRREEMISSATGLTKIPPAPRWRDWLQRIGAALAVVSLVAALYAVGSPFRQRLLQLDASRVSDLRSIQQKVEMYYERQGILPATLKSLAENPTTFLQRTTDPVTGTAYRYERTADDTYTLTATFDLPSPPDREQPRWNRDEFFSHSSGEQLFRLSVPHKENRGAPEISAPKQRL